MYSPHFYLVVTACSLLLHFATTNVSAHGGLHEQIARLTGELAIHPNDPNLHFQLAQLHLQHAEWGKALKSLNRVEQIAPGQFFTGLLRGEIFLLSGKAAKAKSELDQFLDNHPENQKALLLRARAFQKLGKTDQSLSDFRTVWRLTTKWEPDLVIEITDALAAAGQKNEAMEVISKGIEKLGNTPSLALRAMDMEITEGHFDEALDRLSAIEKQAPRPEPWMARRAVILAKAGRVEESRAVWQKLINHLSALPSRERKSHAMSKLAEEARKALKTPDSPDEAQSKLTPNTHNPSPN